MDTHGLTTSASLNFFHMGLVSPTCADHADEASLVAFLSVIAARISSVGSN